MGFASKRLLDALGDHGRRDFALCHGFLICQRVANRSHSYRAALEITIGNLPAHRFRHTYAFNPCGPGCPSGY